MLSGGAVLLALAALVLGAGFTASEFSTGSIGTWLTFEPRRLRVYGSKLLAAGAGVVPLAVLTLATMTAAVWVFAHLWGSTTGPAGTWGAHRRSRWARRPPRRGGRGGGCGDGHPAAAHRRRPRRGARVGHRRRGHPGSNVRSAQPWLLSTNLTGWLQHGTSYLVDRCTSSDGGYSCETIQQPLSFAHSATYLAVLVVALVLVTALVFRRRDVR